MCNKKQCAAEALNAEAARCCRACPMMARKRHQEKLRRGTCNLTPFHSAHRDMPHPVIRGVKIQTPACMNGYC
jgi:hypothetical protein